MHIKSHLVIILAALLGACGGSRPVDPASGGSPSGLEIKLLFGSALGQFCEEAIANFNATNPALADGSAFFATCEAAGSGDVVSRITDIAQGLQAGTVDPDAPDLPTLVSVDGEIYHSQLQHRVDQLFPGQGYIPEITDAPLLANSPMVFMTQEQLAPGLQQTDNLFQALTTAQTHQDIDPNSDPLKIHYVHTAPTRSNSGLQTLVTQFASVSGKRPSALTLDDVQNAIPQVQAIQNKITRYGTSTSSLAKAMVENGPFWASIGSVYESSVIAANQSLAPGQPRFRAVYPTATFTSNMRAILPEAPWVSDAEQEAAEQIVAYLRSPAAQQVATQLGLRPGVPGVALGNAFTSGFGVDPQVSYDSYRPPEPEVVEAMLAAWASAAKKPSMVVVVVDSSGSMEGPKLPSVQNTLQTYISNLGPRDRIALIDFDDQIRDPVVVEGTEAGRTAGLRFISNLTADGGTQLYDAALYARNWLQDNLRPDAINAVLILTDGVDSGECISLDQLEAQLGQSGFNSDQRIAFFTIGYGDSGEFDPQVLETIARLNGGYYSQGDPATIAELMADLQLEF